MFRARNIPHRMTLLLEPRQGQRYLGGSLQEPGLALGAWMPYRSSGFARDTLRRRAIHCSSIDQAEATLAVFKPMPVPMEGAAYGQA